MRPITEALRALLLGAAICTASLVAAQSSAAATPQEEDWTQALSGFRSQREASLRSADGWMALVGLHWLAAGRHAVGSADGAQVLLAAGPHQLGEIELASEAPTAAVLHLKASGLKLDGRSVRPGRHVLRPDQSILQFEGGSLMLIQRGDRFGLRVRSEKAPALLGFKGLNWFAPAPGFDLEARFEPNPAGATQPIVNVLGQTSQEPNPGRVVFEVDGQRYALQALGDPDEALFLIFADRSNAKESYGAGRFLYTGPVVDGRVRLDFNRSINPPCAYTDFSTCPLPPPENRLPIAIRAGEARYGHAVTAVSSAPAR
jgi:uncharacterized protein (DUF1684 family)